MPELAQSIRTSLQPPTISQRNSARASHMPARNTSEPHTGRVALVTGAAHGIGQGIAAGLAERGTRIVLGDIGEVSEASCR